MGINFLWIKAFHVIAVISWMAGLLYLPRLFVYHSTLEIGSDASELLKIMERRLVKAIMVPAAFVTWGLGLTLVAVSGVYDEMWFQIKALLVIAMTLVHLRLVFHKNRFAQDANGHSSKYFRVLNEVPTLLMIGIVLLVIIKPI